MKKTWKDIRLTLLLSLPVLLFYTGYLFNHSADLQPTGFIQYDNVGYVAYAKQYLDQGNNGIFYNNPFNESGSYQPIYFQTQNFFLALLMKAGMPPGWSICLFSLLFCLVAIYTAIKLYDLLFPASPFRTRSILLFVWGGGLLVAAGAMVLPFRPIESLDFFDRLFYLDPAWGWWGLNFGRSLIFGVEAYYHFLFIAALILVLKKRYVPASLLSLILAFSHPFTGIHLVLVLLAWSGAEWLFFRKEKIPVAFIVSLLAWASFTMWYYLIYLPSFPDHKLVSEQYAANWNYRFYHFVPAYLLVFTLFLGSLYLQKVKSFISQKQNRLLLCLAIVSLLLSNHELFMKPMQPIHFARGYEWSAYFLMGVPALHHLFAKLQQKKWIIALIVLLFLMDNFLWIINYVRFTAKVPTTAYITNEQEEVLSAIRKHADTSTLVIGSDDLGYLSAVYSKGYPWFSHPYTTPGYHTKAAIYNEYIRNGNLPQQWRERNLIFIFLKNNIEQHDRSIHPGIPLENLLETAHYRLMGTRKLN